MQTISDSNYSCNITRSLTRLKSVFLTFNGTGINGDGITTYPEENSALVKKSFNNFYHPSGEYILATQDKEIEWQIQLGSKMYPEYPVRSHQESFSQLVKCLGINNSSFHAVDILGAEYRSSKFIIGMDFEKILEAGFTGINTKAGDLMVIKVKQPSSSVAPTANMCNQLHIVLHSDQVLNIRDTSIDVYD
jgi:hypothetical protein